MVQEKAGKKLKDIITNAAEPEKENGCERSDCVLCGNVGEGENLGINGTRLPLDTLI